MLKTIIKIIRIALTVSFILPVSISYADVYFNPFVSISAVNNESDRFKSPVGSIGFELKETKDAKTYFTLEHLSSIPNKHDYGINLIGIGYKTTFKNDIKPYMSINTHNKQLDDNYDDYGGKINTVFIRAGIEYKSSFIELLDNRILLGVKLRLY